MSRPPREPVNTATAAELAFTQVRLRRAEDDIRVLRLVVALSPFNRGHLGLRGRRLVPQRFDRAVPRTADWVASMCATDTRIPSQRVAPDSERIQAIRRPR